MTIDLTVPIWTIEHVAAALGSINVGAARGYTYTAGFPAAMQGFARNLWLREEVLAWFAGLPGRQRRGARRHGAGAAETDLHDRVRHTGPDHRDRHRPGARGARGWHQPAAREGLPAAERGMSTRRAPALEWVGEVTIYAPTSKDYYRLKWQEPDGRAGDTSAGRTLEDARVKAAELDARLAMAASPNAVTALADLVAEYVTGALNPRTGRPTRSRTATSSRTTCCARSVATRPTGRWT